MKQEEFKALILYVDLENLLNYSLFFICLLLISSLFGSKWLSILFGFLSVSFFLVHIGGKFRYKKDYGYLLKK